MILMRMKVEDTATIKLKAFSFSKSFSVIIMECLPSKWSSGSVQLGGLEMQNLKVNIEMMFILLCGETAKQERSLK